MRLSTADLAAIQQALTDSGLPISKLTVALSKQEFENPTIYQMNVNSIEVMLLNPFPISNHDVRLLLQRSEPFTALTGDGSLAEGIENNKIILYQIMGWKMNLFQSLMDLTRKTLFSRDNDKYTFRIIYCEHENEVYCQKPSNQN